MKTSRWAILAIAGAGAAAASAYVVESDRVGAKTAPVVAASARVPDRTANGGTAFADFTRALLPERMQAQPFGSAVVRPKPQPTTVATAPPAAPPAFPYKYAGTLTNGNGVTEAFLLRGTELVPIKVGELLDAAWRIDALTGDRIEVTFVPASERMSLLLASLVAEPGNVAAQSASTPSVARYERPSAAPGVTESSAAPTRSGAIAGLAVGGRAAMAPGVAAGSAAAPRVAGNASAAASSDAASGATGPALGSETPATGTRLGTEPPAQGSMPVGSAPGGSFPKGVTPTGKLGL